MWFLKRIKRDLHRSSDAVDMLLKDKDLARDRHLSLAKDALQEVIDNIQAYLAPATATTTLAPATATTTLAPSKTTSKSVNTTSGSSRTTRRSSGNSFYRFDSLTLKAILLANSFFVFKYLF